jgi:hypothetical protein
MMHCAHIPQFHQAILEEGLGLNLDDFGPIRSLRDCDCRVGTYVGAGSAVDAISRIHDRYVSDSDCGVRTGIFACPASDAFISSDYRDHGQDLLRPQSDVIIKPFRADV